MKPPSQGPQISRTAAQQSCPVPTPDIRVDALQPTNWCERPGDGVRLASPNSCATVHAGRRTGLSNASVMTGEGPRRACARTRSIGIFPPDPGRAGPGRRGTERRPPIGAKPSWPALHLAVPRRSLHRRPSPATHPGPSRRPGSLLPWLLWRGCQTPRNVMGKQRGCAANQIR